MLVEWANHILEEGAILISASDKNSTQAYLTK